MAKKPLSPEARDRAKDKRLQSKYGITLQQQNDLRRKQNNKCKICRVDFTADNPACTDHFHFKIAANRSVGTPFMDRVAKGGWDASAFNEQGIPFCTRWGKSKTAAVAAVKRTATAQMVRGLLCRKCNRGLGYIERFFDSARRPETLTPVMDYFNARHENA